MSSPHFRCTISRLIATLNPLHRTPFQTYGAPALLGLALLSTLSGCRSTPDWMDSKISSTPTELAISQVNPGSSGSFTVSGSTTLPNKTQVTVYAVRYFTKTPDASANPGANPALDSTIPGSTIPEYAILDRQIAKVNQGNWQTQLNLGQSSNGQFLEPWQSSSSASRRNPEPTVTFLAALEPVQQPRDLQQQIESEDLSVQSSIVRYTTDGELYLQASKTLAIPAPQVNLPAMAAIAESQLVRVKVLEPSGASDSQAVQQPQTETPLARNALFR
jgi:subtilisin family serine protease